jgi:hypothetical protein
LSFFLWSWSSSKSWSFSTLASSLSLRSILFS